MFIVGCGKRKKKEKVRELPWYMTENIRRDKWNKHMVKKPRWIINEKNSECVDEQGQEQL